MTTLHTLASGSSGNAALVSCGGVHILVDAGISCRRITSSLRTLGLTPDALSAVLITHTHTDHIAGLQTLLKQGDFPVLASGRTCRELEYRIAGIAPRLQSVELMAPLSLRGCTVTAFPTSHDAAGSCGYRLECTTAAVGVLTDTGYVTSQAREVLPGVDLMVLETNHDVETLRSGPYPYYLKRRILGQEGHLSNEDAAAFAAELVQSGTRELILAHLSQENNTPAMALSAVARAMDAIGASPAVSVAPRHTLSAAHTVVHREGIRSSDQKKTWIFEDELG